MDAATVVLTLFLSCIQSHAKLSGTEETIRQESGQTSYERQGSEQKSDAIYKSRRK